MNNTCKKMVIAALAISAFSTIEAKKPHKNHGKKTHKKRCNDPIVGTWNVELRALPPLDVGEDAAEDAEVNNIGIPLTGVITFHKDCTVLLSIVPEDPTGVDFFGDNTTQYLGIWKQKNCGLYEVLLSAARDFRFSNNADRRFDTRLRVFLGLNCDTAQIQGTFSIRGSRDICFNGPSFVRFNLRGKACKLSLCCPRHVIA